MWYAVYRTSDGELLSVGTVIGDLPDGTAFAECGLSQPSGVWDVNSKSFKQATTLPDRWTKYEFLSRFTSAERIAIRNRASSDVIAADFMEMLSISGEVIRSNPQVMSGLMYLASVGCLSNTRPAEILNG